LGSVARTVIVFFTVRWIINNTIFSFYQVWSFVYSLGRCDKMPETREWRPGMPLSFDDISAQYWNLLEELELDQTASGGIPRRTGHRRPVRAERPPGVALPTLPHQ
jgi:hypothetical protein